MMSFPEYNQAVLDSMDFIRDMRATGKFILTVNYSTFTWTSDDNYTGFQGQVVGALNGYVANYSELTLEVYDLSDVEYKAKWQYEVYVETTWTDADNVFHSVWAWQRDTSVGTYGYLEDPVPLASDGTFGGIVDLDSTHRKIIVAPTHPKLRIYRTSDRLLLGGGSPSDRIWQGYAHVTLLLQTDDPGYNGMPPEFGYRLNTRCWIYAEALVVLAYLATGCFSEARKTLERLSLEQYTADNSPSPYYIGGWPFSFDVFFGRVPEQDYLRNGAIAWTVWAFLAYRMKTRDTTFDSTIILGLDYLLGEQINNVTDNRNGLVPLGWNSYAQPVYTLDYRKESPCAIEHNLDIWQVFTLAYATFNDSKYSYGAARIEGGLLNLALAPDHFNQGVTLGGIDQANALDGTTWGGLFILANQRPRRVPGFVKHLDDMFSASGDVKLESTAGHLNNWYTLTAMVQGYKPYEYYDETEPQAVWSEGTLGAISFLLRTGRLEDLQKAKGLINNTIKVLLYNVNGSTHKGLISITRAYTDWPWEFSIYPSTTNSGWLVVLLKDISILWTPRTKSYTRI